MHFFFIVCVFVFIAWTRTRTQVNIADIALLVHSILCISFPSFSLYTSPFRSFIRCETKLYADLSNLHGISYKFIQAHHNFFLGLSHNFISQNSGQKITRNIYLNVDSLSKKWMSERYCSCVRYTSNPSNPSNPFNHHHHRRHHFCIRYLPGHQSFHVRQRKFFSASIDRIKESAWTKMCADQKMYRKQWVIEKRNERKVGYTLLHVFIHNNNNIFLTCLLFLSYVLNRLCFVSKVNV